MCFRLYFVLGPLAQFPWQAGGRNHIAVPGWLAVGRGSFNVTPAGATTGAPKLSPHTYPQTMQGCTICASFDYCMLNICCFSLFPQPNLLLFFFFLEYFFLTSLFLSSFSTLLGLILLLILHDFFPSLLINLRFLDFFIPSSTFSS